MTNQEKRKSKREARLKRRSILLGVAAVLIVVSMGIDWETLIF